MYACASHNGSSYLYDHDPQEAFRSNGVPFDSIDDLAVNAQVVFLSTAGPVPPPVPPAPAATLTSTPESAGTAAATPGDAQSFSPSHAASSFELQGAPLVPTPADMRVTSADQRSSQPLVAADAAFDNDGLKTASVTVDVRGGGGGGGGGGGDRPPQVVVKRCVPRVGAARGGLRKERYVPTDDAPRLLTAPEAGGEVGLEEFKAACTAAFAGAGPVTRVFVVESAPPRAADGSGSSTGPSPKPTCTEAKRAEDVRRAASAAGVIVAAITAATEDVDVTVGAAGAQDKVRGGRANAKPAIPSLREPAAAAAAPEEEQQEQHDGTVAGKSDSGLLQALSSMRRAGSSARWAAAARTDKARSRSAWNQLAVGPAAKKNMGRKRWSQLAEHVNDTSRPYYIFTVAQSLTMVATQLVGMCVCPAVAGLLLACIPMPSEKQCDEGVGSALGFAMGGLSLLSAVSAAFAMTWIKYCHKIVVTLSMAAAWTAATAIVGPAAYMGVQAAVGFPFPLTVLVVLTTVTLATYAFAYPRIPEQLRCQLLVYFNSLVILGALLSVFLINRVLVVTLAEKGARSLLILSVIYPVLVFCGTLDTTRIAEKYHKRCAATVEAFFTFVSSVFQAILFLQVDAEEVNGWLMFFLINITDTSCLVGSGPLMLLALRHNRRLMSQAAAAQPTAEYTLKKWTSDPLKLKPLLIKTYCEVSAKVMFLLTSSFIRYGPMGNGPGFAFLTEPDEVVFRDMVTFTCIEICGWLLCQYGVELYLRRRRLQFTISDAKKKLRQHLAMLTLNNVLITLMLFLWENCANKQLG